MATAGASTGPASSSTARTKLIVRRLPPTLPEDIFWQSISQWITPEKCPWKRYIKGKTGDGHDARPVHSRAYVLLATADDVVDFHRGFDGHIFRSKTGGEFQAVVEYAPFQKTPHKIKVKVDNRLGTIEDDPDYKSYLDSLNAPPTKPVLETSIPVSQPTSTPLLDHLRAIALAKANKPKKAKGGGQTQSQEPTRDAALAAVSKAAAKRAPQDSTTVTMKAGKGRGVTITPASSVELGGGAAIKSKKNRKAKPGPLALSGEQAVPEKSNSSAPQNTPKNTDRSTGPSRGGGRGGGAGGGTGGEGRGGGRGRGRGQGRDDSAGPRSARGSVVEILSRNAEGDKSRGRGGRGGGGGRGRGGAPGIDPAASHARIDM